MEVTVTRRLCDRRHALSALDWCAAALVILIFSPFAAVAEPPFGDLPPGISKARPSASVPADLPGSRTDPCAIYTGVQLFVPVRGGGLAEVDPAALASANSSPCAHPSAAVHPDTAPGALPIGEASE